MKKHFVNVYALEEGKWWIGRYATPDFKPDVAWIKQYPVIRIERSYELDDQSAANRLTYLLTIKAIIHLGAANVRGGAFSQLDILPNPHELKDYMNNLNELEEEIKRVTERSKLADELAKARTKITELEERNKSLESLIESYKATLESARNLIDTLDKEPRYSFIKADGSTMNPTQYELMDYCLKSGGLNPVLFHKVHLGLQGKYKGWMKNC